MNHLIYCKSGMGRSKLAPFTENTLNIVRFHLPSENVNIVVFSTRLLPPNALNVLACTKCHPSQRGLAFEVGFVDPPARSLKAEQPPRIQRAWKRRICLRGALDDNTRERMPHTHITQKQWGQLVSGSVKYDHASGGFKVKHSAPRPFSVWFWGWQRPWLKLEVSELSSLTG